MRIYWRCFKIEFACARPAQPSLPGRNEGPIVRKICPCPSGGPSFLPFRNWRTDGGRGGNSGGTLASWNRWNGRLSDPSIRPCSTTRMSPWGEETTPPNNRQCKHEQALSDVLFTVVQCPRCCIRFHHESDLRCIDYHRVQIHNQLSIFLTWDNHDNLYNIHGLHGEGTKIVNRIQGHPALLFQRSGFMFWFCARPACHAQSWSSYYQKYSQPHWEKRYYDRNVHLYQIWFVPHKIG